MRRKLRPMGKVLLDLEILLDELAVDHDLQLGEILSLTYNQLIVHNPGCVEEYVDGGSPIYYYGPEEGLKRYGRKRKKS